MSARDDTGIRGPLAAAIGADRGALEGDQAEAVQLELVAGAAEPLLGPLMKLKDGGTAPRVGPGRPPGAKNRRTEAWVEFILARHRSPLIGLAEIVSTPIPQLARDLGMMTAEAATFWRQCAEALAPYLHQKQPQAIDLKGATAGMLVVQIGVSADPGAAERSPFGLPLKIVENQAVTEAAGEVSDAEHSDGEAK